MRPPPGLSPDDAPDLVEVPRMSPPPPSLGAMVEGGRRRLKNERRGRASLWMWCMVAFGMAALTAYLMR